MWKNIFDPKYRKRKKDLGQNQGKFVYLYTEIPDNTL